MSRRSNRSALLDLELTQATNSSTTTNYANAVVTACTCEIKLFQNHFRGL